MKKLFLSVFFAFATVAASAQIMRADELEEYAVEKYGKNWVDAATTLGSELKLNKNNAINYVQVIEAPGQTKEQLYVILNYWFTSTFNDANSVIKLNDKELGTIIAKGYVEDIASHTGGMNKYQVSLEPVIKVDIKEGKVRVTYTLPYYTVVKAAGGGVLGQMGGNRGVRVDENWVLDKCFPFTDKKDSHKKTSSKALVMGHAYSNVIMDKIEEAVKNGVNGSENENW